MELISLFGFLCVGPLFFMFVGAWIAKGMPWLPFEIRRRGRGEVIEEADY